MKTRQFLLSLLSVVVRWQLPLRGSSSESALSFPALPGEGGDGEIHARRVAEHEQTVVADAVGDQLQGGAGRLGPISRIGSLSLASECKGVTYNSYRVDGLQLVALRNLQVSILTCELLLLTLNGELCVATAAYHHRCSQCKTKNLSHFLSLFIDL